MMNGKTFTIAALAGLACVLVVYASIRAGLAGASLFPLAALPVYIATLAWGTHAGVIASISAIVFSAAIVAPQMAVAVGLAFTIPASLIGHQANLAQSDEQGRMVWYPLSQLFFNLTLAVTLGLVAMSVFIGYDNIRAEGLPQIAAMTEQVVRDNEFFKQLPREEIERLTLWTFNTLPFWVAGLWVLVHVVNLQLAALVCRASGLLPRPKDDIAATIHLPVAGLVILGASFAAFLMFDGKIEYYAGHFLGSFMIAFALVGLAGFHLRARTNVGSLLMLGIAYITIIFFFLPIYIFALGGIARTFLFKSKSPPTSGNNNP